MRHNGTPAARELCRLLEGRHPGTAFHIARLHAEIVTAYNLTPSLEVALEFDNGTTAKASFTPSVERLGAAADALAAITREQLGLKSLLVAALSASAHSPAPCSCGVPISRHGTLCGEHNAAQPYVRTVVTLNGEECVSKADYLALWRKNENLLRAAAEQEQ